MGVTRLLIFFGEVTKDPGEIERRGEEREGGRKGGREGWRVKWMVCV